jgi:hypothetical protein
MLKVILCLLFLFETAIIEKHKDPFYSWNRPRPSLLPGMYLSTSKQDTLCIFSYLTISQFLLLTHDSDGHSMMIRGSWGYATRTKSHENLPKSPSEGYITLYLRPWGQDIEWVSKVHILDSLRKDHEVRKILVLDTLKEKFSFLSKRIDESNQFKIHSHNGSVLIFQRFLSSSP